jgi:DNA gyrase/topoisomerase IV subunit B
VSAKTAVMAAWLNPLAESRALDLYAGSTFQKNLATISRGVATTGVSTSNALSSSDAR